ncbi:CRTAC1 family protein [Poseidonocella sedimentorum]|uniref:Repeat domain-containing protein n=1 Tax=Poseidonocella sedimentorum TaxID=871652 RepID=A0A1I6EFS2_9RHOB|nr:CRTAC1 family protein [Poseidonocella sedimentorum]SFR16590.1 Repeat domain-containing protein [Poseidonocella sedimentorum]
MRALALVLALLAPGPGAAEVRFEPVPEALPGGHLYSGGWSHFVGGGVAVFDCNGDNRPELFMAGGASPAALFLNRSEAGKLRFARAELPRITGVTGAYPLDIDSDGAADLVVLRDGENILLRGEGDCAFSRANEAWGFDGRAAWSTAFSATWEAGQSWPTLAIGNYVDRADPEGPFGTCDTNMLYRPSGEGYGAPRALEPSYCPLSMLFSDRGRDRPADLRISNDRHYYLRGGYEQLLRLSDLAWLGEAEGWPRVSIWGMGIASRDLTGDGLPEVMSTSMGDQLLQIARPDGGYDAAPYDLGTYAQRPFIGDDGRPATGWHAEFGDVNNDGRDDLFIAKGNVDQMPSNAMEDPNNLLLQGADGRFTEAAHLAGVASVARGRGAALADLDGDGRLDLVVVNRRAEAEVYRNLSDGGAWLAVSLRQAGANRDAIGARIELEAAGQRRTREVTSGGGHAGGALGPQHFGLGTAEEARLRVRWPDGVWSDWQESGVNRRVLLSR